MKHGTTTAYTHGGCRCRKCKAAWAKYWRKHKEANLIDLFGLCPICQRRAARCSDHDHETGEIRGRLCRPCNLGLGMLGDDEPSLLRALAYLRGEQIYSSGVH